MSWLGALPTGWNAKRLKYVSSINDETLHETTDPDYELLYVDIGSVDATEGIQKKELMFFEDAPSRARRIVRDGDTIVSTVRTYLRAVAPIEQPEENLIVSTGFAVIRPQSMVPKYLAYCLRSSFFIETVVSRSVGVSYPATNPTDISCIEVSLPPRKTQQTIADFLDAQTVKLDALMAKKREFIAKLKEKRSALIAHTVTRGLPLNAAQAAGLVPHPAMKDSGVEWIGKIPTHWKVKRLKFVFPRLFSGVSVNSESAPTEEDFPGVLKTSCVYGNQFHPDENKRVLEGEIDRISCPVTRDSLIISRMNTPDLVGNCGYAEYDYPNLFLPDRLWIARFQNHSLMHGKFAWYLVSSHGVNQLTGILATGTSGSMKNLSQDAFLNVTVALPPAKEQQAIAAYLDRETARIDQLAARVEAAIARLTEYRQALITAAVTGKIDVSQYNTQKEARHATVALS